MISRSLLRRTCKPLCALTLLALAGCDQAAPSALAPTTASTALPTRPAMFGAAGPTTANTPVIDHAIAAVYPALVRIHVVTVDYEFGREQRFEAGGSGVIISPEGYVVTNHHVAGKAKWIRCILADQEELDAKLVGTDPLADISVLKLDLSERASDAKPLPFAKWGDSSKLQVGDPVLAMGSPLTISQSVTQGIVSNTNMTIPSFFWPFTFTLDGETVGEVVRWIGHDAAIYPGNSGGPLVNLQGDIVGINEIDLGLSGAIPSNLAKSVADELIAHGQVRRSWIGLELQPVLHATTRETDTAAPTEPGALVSGVIAGSPAAKAGILPGDVLLRYAGHPVNVHFAEELPAINRLMLETPVGAKVTLVVSREGSRLEKSLVTELREPARGDEAEMTAWGITVRDFTRLSALEARHADSGIFVYSLRDGGPAAEAKPHLEMGDVIEAVNNQPVKDIADLKRVSAAALASAGDRTVLVKFDRGTQHMITAIDLNPKERDDQGAEVKKAWLPIEFQVLTSPIVAALGLPEDTTGVRITALLPGYEGDMGGLKVGDMILTVDHQRVEASQPEDRDVFPAMIRQYKIGSSAELGVLREGHPLKLTVHFVDRPAGAGELTVYANKRYNFKARDLVLEDRVENQWPLDQGGALVTDVQPGGWASIAHLAIGDLILDISGHPIQKASDLKFAFKALDEAKPKYADFFVRRGIHTMYLEVVTDYASSATGNSDSKSADQPADQQEN
ncbi:MAG: trypsin-like peptidase domain-containing protein [Planctomycetota bacterium]